MSNQKKYKDFTCFLADETFISKISDPLYSEDYLDKLIKEYPGQSENILLAKDIFHGMKNVWITSSYEQRKQQWDRMIYERNRKIRWFYLRLAASFLLLIGFGSLVYIVNSETDQSSIEEFAFSTRPAYDQSRLILSDGQQIVIDGSESNVVYSDDGERVDINDTTAIITDISDKTYNQLIVPFGKTSKTILSDGTKVWINSGSRVIFPSTFTGTTREVFVQGEAYFEVTKNESKPFIVRTERFVVEVTGTRFSVMSYESSGMHKTLLIDGTVSVSTDKFGSRRSNKTILTPGQQASLSIEDGKTIKLENIPFPDNYVAWIYGYLVFKEEPLQDVLKRISRYYNINVETGNSKKNLKVTGKLDLKEDPERVLNGISITIKAKLNKMDDRYTIY